jgi:hypothetical protein|tara:strand:- start:5102 stop:5254 length:153 start_codon:yes stop_codon:yes gene_type:complete
MKTFRQLFDEEMTSTASVAGAGDDSQTVVVRKKKKPEDAPVLKRDNLANK